MNNKRHVDTAILVQARLNSTRLPNKVVLEIGQGKTAIEILMSRLMKIKSKVKIVIITPIFTEDNILTDLCKKNNWNVFSGSETDLLDRHYKAAKKYDVKNIIKIPSDCVFTDPGIVDDILNYFHSNNYDYVSNLHPETFPYGFDVEIMNFETLHLAWKNSKKKHEREHTTPYIVNNPKLFNIGNYRMPGGKDFSKKYRIVLDYSEDLELLKIIYANCVLKDEFFNVTDIIDFLEKNADVANINRIHFNSQWYNNLDV